MEWIKVTDRLPEVDKEILYTNGKMTCKGFYGYLGIFQKDKGLGFIDRESWNDGTGFDEFDNDTTHWMELPKFPSDGN